MYGRVNAIRRVKVINPTSTFVDRESFVLGLWGNPNMPSEGNVIEECEVSQCHGAYTVTAFVLNAGDLATAWVSGIMRNNRVVNSPDASNIIGFNHGQGRDILVTGNYTDGAILGLYADTGHYTNAICSFNVFKDCGGGIFFNFGGDFAAANYSCLYNHIELQPNYPLPYHAAGIASYVSVGVSGLTFIGNTVQYNGGLPGVNAAAVELGNATGVLFANNVLDTNMTISFPSSTKVNFFNNRDFAGNPVLPFGAIPMPIEPANGTVRRKMTSGGNILLSDRYVGVAVSTSSTFRLPSAVGCAGKDFIVVNESGSTAKITIATPSGSGQTINGVNNFVTITTAYGSKTLISNGANWFAW